MAIGIVKTKYGKLQGVELEGKYEGITYFKGVPYAKPPVGKLRWKPPVDPAPWEGVKMCDVYPPAPIQKFVDPNIESSHLIGGDEFYFQGVPSVSEDCLYINICTGAQKPGEKRPVYMWYHGGGLTNGFSYEIEFNPEELARKGIIVVQVGQRLNSFGYMSLPQLSAEQGKSGNYGLMDQVKALDWLTENIEAFGGDPENISVGGQSGGTWRACALVASPKTRGRVKHIINQSHLHWHMMFHTMEEAEKIGTDFLTALGIDPNASLEELRAIPAEKFIWPDDIERSVVPGDMVYDGEYVPFLHQREAFDKYLDGVDFLNMADYGEVGVFDSPDAPTDYYAHHKMSNHTNSTGHGGEFETAEEFYSYYKTMLGDLYDEYDFEKLVPVTDKTAWNTARWLAALGLRYKAGVSLGPVMMDRIFGMYMKERYPQNKCFSALWAHLLPNLPEDIGGLRDSERLLAFHSSELWYVFASLREGVPQVRPWRDVDYKIADMMSSYWANFIKTGDPNGEGLPYWPESGDNYGYAILGENVVIGKAGDGNKLDELIMKFAKSSYGV